MHEYHHFQAIWKKRGNYSAKSSNKMINHIQLYLALRRKPPQERFEGVLDQIIAIWFLGFAAAVGAIVMWLLV